MKIKVKCPCCDELIELDINVSCTKTVDEKDVLEKMNIELG